MGKNTTRFRNFLRVDDEWTAVKFEHWQKLITRTSFVYKTLRLVRISLLISNVYKEFCFFSQERYFMKAIENFFPMFA